ncbi:MAG: carboxypeptidase-like regulatory domain-containing protein, partial [Planctomycetota bacterium]
FIARLPEELVELVADRSNDDGWVTVDGTRLSDRRGLRVRSKEFGTQTISDLQPKELRLLPTGSLRGRVAGEELEQYEGIDFLIQTDEGNVGGVATVKLNDRGEFFVPKLAAGRGHILFSNWNPSLPMHPIAGGRWRVDEEEEMNLTIDLVKPVTVHGRVLLEDTNEPLPNASVTINSLQSPINGARTKTDREGRFTLRVAPGRCLRQLTSFGGGEESKVLFDEYDYPRFDPFDLDDASSEVTFDPWFVSRRANVRIRLVDTSGRPVASKTVAIHRKQSAFLIGDQETTDSHGECEMKVREWKLMANNRDVRNAYQWSLVTEAPKKREFLWKGIPLRVLESTANSVTLQFSPHDAEVQLNFPH